MLKYIKMIFAAFIYAVGIELFLEPNELAPGGITGVAIILEYMTEIHTGTLFFILNIPILILGIEKFGKSFIFPTLFSVSFVAFFSNILAGGLVATKDQLLAAVIGGTLSALGMGIIIRAGGTTGGTDIIVKILRQKYQHLKTGTFHLMIDATVILLSVPIFGKTDKALYAAISAIILSLVLDVVLYGKDEAKLVFVISKHAEQIAKRSMTELQIGVTFLYGKGGYEQESAQIILCVMKKQLANKFEEIVSQEDEAAFMIISRASEIYGKGYKSYFGEKL